jgi:gamma-glutamyltranspeptidase / glutathione hydrolase
MHGPLAVSVPGAVDGWFELHARFGRLPMARLLEPSIQYAESGVPVPQVIAHNWQLAVDRIAANQADITDGGNFAKTFTIDGRAPREGDVFRNPDLARTYRLIAEGGRDAFYRGPIAEALDRYARRVGLHLRKADFEQHTSTWVDPVSVNYRGFDIYQLPPNGQGIAGLQMLNILEGYDLAAMGHNSADYLHVQAEAKKLAFADRARHYADPEFSDVPLTWLLSKEYAAERRDADRHGARAAGSGCRGARHAPGRHRVPHRGRSGRQHGLAHPEQLPRLRQRHGAGRPRLSASEPRRRLHAGAGHPNVYAPGKRPFHTIIPGFIMKDGRPHISFGVMGGPVQPQGHVQIVCNLIDFGMNLQEAGDAARYVHAGSSEPTGQLMTDGGRLALESRIPADVRAELERRGHTVISEEFFGGYQAILWDPERRVYIGASEMRKDGQAVGY